MSEKQPSTVKISHLGKNFGGEMNIYDPSIFDNSVFVIGNITRNSEKIVLIAKVHKSA